MKNDLPPACIFQIFLTINSESTWPGLTHAPINIIPIILNFRLKVHYTYNTVNKVRN